MATDTSGNQAVDFVWGNMPLQPNEGRTTPLDPELDGHNIASFGYNGYPGNTGAGTGVVVPDVAGNLQAAAEAALKAAGFAVGTVTGTGSVTGQDPAAGEYAHPGSAVGITLA